jgi:glycosyltransferase involved in cell wall biosynthesis
VLALHDANIYDIPDAFSRPYRMWHRALRPRLARRAAALITVSRFSARALAGHLGVPEARFHIVPNGADHIHRVAPDPSVLRRHGLAPQGYLLSVGNQSPNKNIARLIAAHGAADGLPLVVVGGGVPGVACATVCASGRVRLPGRVSDGQLRALYDGAAGFVFPSLYEGFGIPPLEAMACGVPVLAARGTALPEVLGDAALWFDPRDTADITRALCRFAGLTAAERAILIAKGRARARSFTWDASAVRLMQVLAGAVAPMNVGPARIRPAL